MPSDLLEALTAANVAPLLQKRIDPLLLEYVRRYAPLVQAIPTQQWNADVYYWNTESAIPPGGAVLDGGTVPVGASTFVQNSAQMKHLMSNAAVTGYARAVTAQTIGDLFQQQLRRAAQGLAWDIEAMILWGCAAATAAGPGPEFDGLDQLVNTYSGVGQNVTDAAGAELTTGMLDQMILSLEDAVAQPVTGNDWMFVVPPSGDMVISQALVALQRYIQTTVDAGLVVPTYKSIPFIKSSFLSTRNLTMSAVTTTAATTGGALPAGTYYYRVSAVIARQGEIAASPEVSATTTGATGTVTLAFTPPIGLDSNGPLLYKVYRGSAAGGETLLGTVDANFALAADGVTRIPTTSIVDAGPGAGLIPMNGATAPATLPGGYFGTAAGFTPRTGADIYLMSRNRDFIVRPWVRDIHLLDVAATLSAPDSMPISLETDTTLALRAPKYIQRLRNVGTSIVTTNPVQLTHSV